MAPHRAPSPRRAPATVVTALLALLVALSLAPPAAHAVPVEDYASYEPQRKCSPKAKPGMELLARWTVERFGGTYGGISRACGGSASEHKEGRAFDWMVDADSADDRDRVERFLTRILKTDRRGNEHALARRMGIMYLIWDDQMYAAYDRFAPRPYLHSGCKKLSKCSKTLRHRDHVHISLTRAGGKGTTSWYVRQLRRAQRSPQERVAARVAAAAPTTPAAPAVPAAPEVTEVRSGEDIQGDSWGFAS